MHSLLSLYPCAVTYVGFVCKQVTTSNCGMENEGYGKNERYTIILLLPWVRVGIMVREVHEFARVEEYGKN